MTTENTNKTYYELHVRTTGTEDFHVDFGDYELEVVSQELEDRIGDTLYGQNDTEDRESVRSDYKIVQKLEIASDDDCVHQCSSHPDSLFTHRIESSEGEIKCERLQYIDHGSWCKEEDLQEMNDRMDAEYRATQKLMESLKTRNDICVQQVFMFSRRFLLDTSINGQDIRIPLDKELAAKILIKSDIAHIDVVPNSHDDDDRTHCFFEDSEGRLVATYNIESHVFGFIKGG